MIKRKLWFVPLLVAAFFLSAGAFGMQEAFFESDGVNIRYLTAGEGEPVILIHGFSANTEIQWVAPGIFSALAQDYRVIAFDNRGHGKSDKPHGAENYGPKMVNDIINLMDHLDIDKAHVAGYSLGGFITLNLVVNHPDRIQSAVVGGAGWQSPDVPNELPERIAESLESGQGLGPLFEALTPPGGEGPSPEELAGINQMLTAMNDVKALASVMRGMKNLSVSKEAIAKNEVPVLGVVGELDPLRLTTTAMEANMANVADVVVIEGGDHMTAMNDKLFAESIKSFFASHDMEGEEAAVGAIAGSGAN